MDNLDSQSAGSVGPAEDPPPPSVITFQEQSTSESLGDSSGHRRPPPPLSPLTGCYLLIVIGEPHSERHKEIILQKIAKAFLSWDVSECHVSLEKELQTLTEQSPQGEEARYGERLIQYATENLVTEILIHSQLNTLHQCMKNLLSSFTKHRHIIHAGYTFAGNGSWILQDGTLSISDLVEALQEPEVTRVLKAYENSVSIDIHCASEGDWTTERFQSEPISKLCNIRVNPGDIMTAGNPAISKFIEYLSPFLEPANIQELLQPTDVVGNIRFTHPTLYVFPGGQGDAALFGINGFNMLIDGGFARKACFWDFARHLDRLDAVLLTRLNNSTVSGISAVLQRKKMNHVYPQIGHFFCNLQDRKIALSPDGDKDKDSLIVNLAEEGQEIVANLRHLALKPHPCYRDGNQVDPVNLYHKVGHGKLDMYVISPARDSQAVKDFLAKWTSNDGQLFSNTGKKVGGKAFEFPLQNLVSICALLVWQPANPNDTITRILFPGSTPQHKIFEGLEKLKHLEFLKHSVCSARSISPSASTIITNRSSSKTKQPKIIISDNKQREAKTSIKSQVKPLKVKSEKLEKTPLKEIKPKIDTNKLTDEKKETETYAEEPLKKLDNRILSKDEQIENIKKEIHKIEQAGNEEQKKKIVHKSKYDMRNVKSKVDSRAPSKSVDRKKMSEKRVENESSPPSTPKKAITNGVATKGEKTKIMAKVSASPLSTPAKSAKEANNRKVVEARVTSTLSNVSNKSLTRKKEDLINTKERKPMSRRPKGATSPIKSAPTKPAKTDAESLPKKIIKKSIKDSTVIESVGEIIAKKPIEDAEIKKTEVDEQKINDVEIRNVEEETTENKETDAMAVKTEYSPKDSQDIKKNIEDDDEEEEEDSEEGGEEEEEEYLIVTKEEELTEELVRDSENIRDYESYQEDVQTKDETEEGEMKKLLREAEESEKKRESLEEIKGEQINKEFNEKNNVIGKEKINQMTKDRENLEENKNVETEKICERSEERIPGPKEIEVQKIVDSAEGTEPVIKGHKEGESLPEEKVSNTVETSATTAPTLPEDEKLDEPLLGKDKSQPEEIREVVEEKYIQEETKEGRKPENAEENLEGNSMENQIEVEGPPIIPSKSKKPRDVVKTPDEVADLPVHEEVDPRMYSSGLEFTKDFQKKTEEKIIQEGEIGEKKSDYTTADKGEANLLDEKKPANESPYQEKQEEATRKNLITSKYLNIIDELEKSASDSRRESPELGISKDEQMKTSEDPKMETDHLSETSSLHNQKYAEVTKFIETEKQINQKSDTRESGEIKSVTDLVDNNKESKTSGEIGTSDVNEKPVKTEDISQVLGSNLESCIFKDILDRNTPEIISRKSIPIDVLEKEKVSYHSAEVERSGKSMPQISGKTSPQNPQEKSSRKSSLQQSEISESNKEISKQEIILTEPPSVPNIEKNISGKITPQYQQFSRESSPVEPDSKIFSDKAREADMKTEEVVSNLEKFVSVKSESESMQDKKPRISQILDEEKSKDIVMHEDISTKVPLELSENVLSLKTKSQSGRSTPDDRVEALHYLEGSKDYSGQITPGEILKVASKPGSPAEVDNLSGKKTFHTDQDIYQESRLSISGRASPQIEEPVCGESKTIISGKSSPQVEEPVRRESQATISGKSSPQIEEPVRRESQAIISGKSSPQVEEPVRRECQATISGKSSPQIEEPVRRESQAIISGKSSPQVQEPVRRESQATISGKSSPQIEEPFCGESKTIILGKTSPQVEEPVRRESQATLSGKTSPQVEQPVRRESQATLSGKSSPQIEEPVRRESQAIISGKSSPQVQEPVRRESQATISGKSSPQIEEPFCGESKTIILGKTSPQVEQPVRRESQATLSGKSSPQVEEPVRRKSQTTILGKSSPQIEEPVRRESQAIISGKSSPPIEEPVSRESQATISGKSSPQIEEPLGRDSKSTISGKVSPQVQEPVRKESQDTVSGKSSPPIEEPVRRESQATISGKSCPQVQETVRRESQATISGKSSPQIEEPLSRDSKTTISGKVSPQTEEPVCGEPKTIILGKSSPQVEEPVRRESKINILERTSQTDVPASYESNGILTYKSSPQDLEKLSGLGISVVTVNKSSGKSTPQDFSVGKHFSDQDILSSKTISRENVSEEKSENVSQEKPDAMHDRKSENEKIICGYKITGEITSLDTSYVPKVETSSVSSRRESAIEEVDKSDFSVLPLSNVASDSTELKNKISTESTVIISEEKTDTEKIKCPAKGETPEPQILQQTTREKSGRADSQVSYSISPENNISGRSTPSSLNKKTSGKSSPTTYEKLTSDSISTAFAEKGTSVTYSIEKEKSSSLSPVNISPISMDKIKEVSEEISKEKRVGDDEKETDSVKSIVHHKEGIKSIGENLYKNPLERLKYEEGESSGTSTPERSHRETPDVSVTNGIESEEELEKGTLESERQEKESQILDVSSGEEEELKGLGVDDDDGDSEQELRREKYNFEEENIILMSGSRAEVAKDEKDDHNKLVKIGNLEKDTEEDLILDKHKGVRRMLVTASSEDGGTEIEISLQGGTKSVKDTEGETESDVQSSEDEFKNLIIQAKKEYISQRLRKTSSNSAESDGNDKDDAEDLESIIGESENEKEEEELSTLLRQARQELAFVRSKSRESQIVPESEKVTTKTTTTSETTQINDNDTVTITTILTEERTEQEDGSIKLTTTKETKTKGGKDEGTIVVVNTKIEKNTDEKESRNGFSSFPQERKSVEKIRRSSLIEGEHPRAEAAADSRRSSISSIASQREIVFRRDSGKFEDIRRSSGEIGPLKTTYITSHGDSESLMTSSFYGDMPSQEKIIKMSDYSGELRKERTHESYTEISSNGEKTERTYVYRAEEEPVRVGGDGSRFRAYYTEDHQSDPKRLVYRYYASEIPEEETEERIEREYYEETPATEVRKRYRFVECSSPDRAGGHIEFSKAIHEHVSTRGEYLGKEIRQDMVMHTNGKDKLMESEEAIEEEEDRIEEASGTNDESDEKLNKKDIIENWGKPLGLPLPPKNINKTYSFPGQNISTTSSLSTPTDNSDSVTNWGQPMSLPSPAPPLAPNGVAENIMGKMVNGDGKNTPKTEKKIKKGGDAKGSGSNTPNRRSESPVKQSERRAPSVSRTNRSASNSHLYLDLTYVPHHGNSYYSNVEFFKKVRARYYVFSGTEPSREVYNALLEAKQTWEDKKLEVTIIPTYDTDVLGYWVAENEEILAKNKIDLSPSASRCTINLQDHETSCSAYRLEF